MATTSPQPVITFTDEQFAQFLTSVRRVTETQTTPPPSVAPRRPVQELTDGELTSEFIESRRGTQAMQSPDRWRIRTILD